MITVNPRRECFYSNSPGTRTGW